MQMEQETINMLTGGFSIVMGTAFIVVLLLLFSKKRKPYRMAYAFVIVYFLLFSTAVFHVLQAISFNMQHPAASEEISLRLGTAGVLWAFSMLFLLFGLVKLSSIKTNSAEM